MYTQSQIEKTAKWLAKEIAGQAADGVDCRALGQLEYTLRKLLDCQDELQCKLESLAGEIQAARALLEGGGTLDAVVRDNGRQIDVLVERRAQLTKAVEVAFLALGLDPDGISAIPED